MHKLLTLESQIKPHFFFNTLNTISAYIRTNPDKARALLQDFSEFYWMLLINAESSIPFAKELEFVDRYVEIDQARFGKHRICVEKEIAPDVPSLFVPPFLLQPLVENAIVHGMSDARSLHITISAGSEGDNFYICVKDDGVGMTQERLRQLLQHGTLKTPDALPPIAKHHAGLSLKRLRERIEAHYPGSEIEITSKQGEGTRVKLVLNKAWVSAKSD